MNKVFEDAQAALHDVVDGVTILSGGFGLSGNPENCIRELARRAVKGRLPADPRPSADSALPGTADARSFPADSLTFQF